MKNNFKRILSIFLVAVMCLSLIPMSVFAADAVKNCPECKESANVTPEEGGEVKEATCDTAAGQWYVCSAEHYNKEDGTPYGVHKWFVPVTGSLAHHSNPDKVEYTPAKAPKCNEDGNVAYYTCTECGKNYSSFDEKKLSGEIVDVVVPMDDAYHRYIDNVVEPVCGVSDGYTEHTCEYCGDYYKDNTISNSHEWTITDESYASDEIGCMTECDVTLFCGREGCGASKVVKGYGWKHETVEVSYVAPTCSTAGHDTYYTCRQCDKLFADVNATVETTLEEVNLPAQHTLSFTAYNAATCVADGNVAYYTCSGECGNVYGANPDGSVDLNTVLTEVKIEAAGHDVVFKEAKTPDCVEDGYTAYYDCKNCDLYFAAVAEGDTAYTDAKVYYNGAEITVKAVAKDSWLTGEEKRGHDFEDKDAVVGNCTTVPTIAHKYCAVCEKNYAVDADEFEALENALESILATVYVPNVNYNPYKDSADKKLVAVGSEGATITETTQHNWVLTIEKDSTCEQAGVITWHCADCDKYTGTAKPDQGIVGLIVYDLAVLNHLAVVDQNAIIVPAVPGTCVANGKSAYVQCPACSMYLVVGEDGTVDYSRCYADTNGTAFITAKDANNHAPAFVICYDAKDETCTEDGRIASYWCFGGCGLVYSIDNGTVVTYEGEFDGDEANLPEAVILPKHNIVYFVEERVAINCGDNYNPAYCYCSCGKIYGVKSVDGELVADYDVTYTAPVAIRQHEYSFVEATFNCGYDGISAHYKCTNPACDKVFFKFIMGGVDKYVETTLDALKVTATGDHNYVTVDHVQMCIKNEQGVAGKELCTVCLKTRTVSQHDFCDLALDYHGYKAPTCTAEGVGAYKCLCGLIEGEFGINDNGEEEYIVKTYVLEKLPHNYYNHVKDPAWIQYKAPTCLEDGNVEYYVCNMCGGKFTSGELTEQIPEGEEIIPATHKTLTGVIDYAPVLVCGTVYAEQKYCTICDSYSIDNFATFQDEPYTTADVTYHVGDVMLLIPADDPTCESSGSKAIYTCDKCGKFLVEIDGKYYEVGNDNDYIAPLKHEGKFVAYKAPTCTATGNYAYYVCENGCGKLYGANEDGTINTAVVYADDSQIIAANGHTQTEANTVAAVPSVCDGVYSITYGNIKYYVCDDCGKMFADGETAADAVALDQFSMRADPHEQIDHIVDGSIVLAKCTEVGYYAMQCECGYTYYKFIAPLKHKITDKNETKIDSDCQKTGLEVYYYCDNCDTYYKDAACTEAWGTSIADVTIAKKAHTNKDGVVIEATCDNGEFVWDAEAKKWVEIIPDRECQWCDYNGTLAHTWVSGHSEQTCITPESDYKVCKICENIDENTREVYGEKDPTKHGTLVEKITEGTKYCTDSNRYYKECKLCGEAVGSAYAGKHTTTTVTVAATCTATGTKTTTCKNCEYKNVETLPVTDHKAGSWVTNKKYSDGKTNLYTVADAQAKYCVNKNCSEPNKALDTRAMPDVNFAVSLDSGVKAGAELVNSGKLAVTIKLSAYQLKACVLDFSFNYSSNLTFDRVELGALGNMFKDTTYDAANGKFSISSVHYEGFLSAADVAINGADVVYAVVYFDIADAKTEGTVTINSLKVNQLKLADNTDVTTTIGKNVAATYSILGDVDGDGVVGGETLAVMNLISNGTYDASIDFDKDGYVTVADFMAYRAFTVDGDYSALVSSKS